MANFYRNRSLNGAPWGRSLARSLWGLTKLLIALAIIATARRTSDSEFSAPAPTGGGGDKDETPMSDMIEKAMRLLGL